MKDKWTYSRAHVAFVSVSIFAEIVSHLLILNGTFHSLPHDNDEQFIIFQMHF